MIIRSAKTTYLNLVYPIVLILISIVTILLQRFGPTPFIDYSNGLVNVKELALVEKRDQYILYSWWSIFLLLAILLLFRYKMQNKKFYVSKTIYILILIGIGLTLLSAFWTEDLHQKMTGISLWSGISPVFFVFGGIIVVILFLGLDQYYFLSRKLIKAVLITISFIYILPNLIQFPKYLDDQNHFNFVANDLIANSIGKTILFDYFPVYTNLLGIPIIPLLKFSPTHPIQITVYYLVILQALIILLAFLLIKSTVPKRLISLSFVVFILPIFATGDIGRSPSSYFPIFPLRIIVPLICIYLTMKILFYKNYSWLRLFTLGIILGVNVLNNLEFGLTSSLSIIIASMILLRKIYSLRRFLIGVMSGLLLTLFLIYVFFSIINKPLEIEELFLFIKLTLSGYYAVPMDAMGIHLIIVSFFITSCIISAYHLLRNPFSNSKILRRNFYFLF